MIIMKHVQNHVYFYILLISLIQQKIKILLIKNKELIQSYLKKK